MPSPSSRACSVCRRHRNERVESETWRKHSADREVLVCHLPYQGDSGETERYRKFRPVDEGLWLLHGHVHEKWRQQGRMVNVGVDVWYFTPVPEEVIARLIDDAPLVSD